MTNLVEYCRECSKVTYNKFVLMLCFMGDLIINAHILYWNGRY